MAAGVSATAVAWKHVAFGGGFSAGPAITKHDATAIDVDGRRIDVQSSLAHTVRSFRAVGGFSHHPTRRVRLDYLGGVALTHLSRRFSTDAARQLLVFPSNVPAQPTSVETSDWFVAPSGELQVLVGVRGSLWIVGGVRVQSLHVEDSLSGVSIVPSGGLAWTF